MLPRRLRLRLGAAAATACVAATATVTATALPTSAATAPAVRAVPISFQVQNINRSAFPCASDGRTYTVRGHLVAPAAQLSGTARPSGTTLYLHGLNFGEFLWRDTAVPERDYATLQARAGLTSVVIDRLGYGASDKPDGNAICAGSRADIAHQMVLALRSGAYQLTGQAPFRFAHVALAGHSYGGQIAELEAYSFGDIDALAVISYTDQGSTPLAAASSAYTNAICAKGGLQLAQYGPKHYAPFGKPDAAKASLFNDTDPLVRAVSLGRLTLNPCGDMVPFNAVAAANLPRLKDITVPVLVVSGGADKLFPVAAGVTQATLYTGSPRVSRVVVPRAGHAITEERALPSLLTGVRAFLRSTTVA